MERKKVGEVFHFFGKISVAAIRLTDGSLAIGDTVQIQGPSTNLEQTVDALQIEHAAVSSADPGQEVGMKVRDRVREKDFVYKLIATAEPLKPPAPPPRAPTAPRAVRRAARPKPRRKAPRKKGAPKRSKPSRKKSTRATRSKGRRGSRGSRRRTR